MPEERILKDRSELAAAIILILREDAEILQVAREDRIVFQNGTM